MPNKSENPADVLENLIKKAKATGADAADAMLVDGASLSVGYRLGKVETLERSEGGDLGLRVFIGKKQAIVSSTDRSPDTLNQMVERAVAMAKLAPDDPFCGISEPSQIGKNPPRLDMADNAEPTAEQMIAMAKTMEEAARSVKGVSNSEGAELGAGSTTVTLAASNGFTGSYRRTGYSMSASVIAGEGTGMERDYDHASRVFMADMPKPDEIGRKAGERAVRRLHPRKMPTAQVPVVFDPRISNSIPIYMAGGISGSSIARGTSFLKDMMGKKIFPDNVTIIDDPFRPRGLRSRPFDAEGIMPEKRKIIDRGVLTSWLLDLRSARQLNLPSTGHAARSPGGTPTPSGSNLYVEPGALTPAELIRDIKQGFYVTELMGMGVNNVTGDYSQAASGFWIENGQITCAVNEMTIASNLKDMFLNLTAANDLEFLRGTDAPTLRVESMTVAGV